MKKFLFICMTMICLISFLNAFPFANYGNVRVPDAYVMPHLMGELAINNYFYPKNNNLNDSYTYNWAVALNMGLFNHGEIGLVASGDEIYYGQVRIRMIGETIRLPDISVGIDNIFSKVPAKTPFGEDFADVVDAGNYRRNTLYLVLSKTTLLGGIPALGDVPTRITIGAGTHRFHGTVPISEQFEGLFGAIQFEPARNFATIIEIDGHNLNTGFKYHYRGFTGKLDFHRIEEWNRRDPKIGFTISYIFDQLVAPRDMREFSPFRTFDYQIREVRERTPMEELQRIRRQRERAEEELEEIRRLLEEE